jgi:hypothetical protein
MGKAGRIVRVRTEKREKIALTRRESVGRERQ